MNDRAFPPLWFYFSLCPCPFNKVRNAFVRSGTWNKIFDNNMKK